MILWASVPHNSGTIRANTYYRTLLPFRVARDLKLVQDYFVEGITQSAPMELGERALVPLMSDVLLLSNVFGEGLTKNIQEIKKLKSMIDPDTLRREYPPVAVFDQDDLTHRISIFNDAYWNLGTRAPDGTPLKEGDSVYMRDSKGNAVPLWEDGVCHACKAGQCMAGYHAPFDIERNQGTIEKMESLAKACHGATFPNERLARFYREEVGLTNTYVFPNSVYEKDYPRVDLADHPDEVRVLWQGGSSHFEDWIQYKGILGRVAAKYPHVKFILWGQAYGWLIQEIPQEQREFISWCDHSAYLTRLNTIGHDINLAPLTDNLFNNCKSAIKWYESSAITRPAATLASDVPPYSDEIIHMETGLLAKSPEVFEYLLCTLVEDATFRKRLASNAKDWVHENRNAVLTVPPLIEWYLSLRDQYDVGEPVALTEGERN